MHPAQLCGGFWTFFFLLSVWFPLKKKKKKKTSKCMISNMTYCVHPSQNRIPLCMKGAGRPWVWHACTRLWPGTREHPVRPYTRTMYRSSRSMIHTPQLGCLNSIRVSNSEATFKRSHWCMHVASSPGSQSLVPFISVWSGGSLLKIPIEVYYRQSLDICDRI